MVRAEPTPIDTYHDQSLASCIRRKPPEPSTLPLCPERNPSTVASSDGLPSGTVKHGFSLRTMTQSSTSPTSPASLSPQSFFQSTSPLAPGVHRSLGSSKDTGRRSPGAVHLDPGPPYLRNDVLCATSASKLSPQMHTRGEVELSSERETTEMGGAQAQLAEYRQRLARDLEMRERSARNTVGASAEKTRVSPIEEESADLRSEESAISYPPTTSTESGNTIRAGVTPGVTPGVAATPSYPFPRMSSAHLPSPQSKTSMLLLQKSPFSPTYTSFSLLDRALPSSSDATPSTFTFQPGGAGTPDRFQNDEYPTPNLYELCLMLTAEPGLDAWWETVVQIMTQVYKAERVTLSVPADSTDLENVPWGQRATYNAHQEDEMSLGYLAKSAAGDSSAAANTADLISEPPSASQECSEVTSPARPDLISRHSFTSFEQTKDRVPVAEEPAQRPPMLPRSKSCMPSGDAPDMTPLHAALNKTALEQLGTEDDGDLLGWEASLEQRRSTKARVHQGLQALDYEADPLIDHSSIMRVVKRGKVIALTRTYPYLHHQGTQESNQSTPSTKEPVREATKKKSSLAALESSGAKASPVAGLGQGSRATTRDGVRSGRLKARFEEELHRPPSPKYEEYEQMPQSPWTQSPAPSPAIRGDPKENPFFADAVVDESSFNPRSSPEDYSSMPPPEAIGIDNSASVLHIPLNHVVLSHNRHPFYFDSTTTPDVSDAKKQTKRDKFVYAGTPGAFGADSASGLEGGIMKSAPIAILSILSPVIPYPTNLRRSLGHLSMHLATSFSLCRHHSTLETELAGLKRRKPMPSSGFGGLTSDGRSFVHPSTLVGLGNLHTEDLATQSSIAGSLTSLSDYSALSRSAVGSPMVTPGLDQANLGASVDRSEGRTLATSPLPVSEESYFSVRHPPVSHKADKASSSPRRTRATKDGSGAERRRARGSSGASSQPLDTLEAKGGLPEDSRSPLVSEGNSQGDRPNTQLETRTPGLNENDTTPVQHSGDPSQKGHDPTTAKKPPRHRHTMLHSYGADFATTFPSLPPSTTLSSKPPLGGRSGSMMTVPSSTVDMPPPSDRLKGLILDSLPAHVFIALQQTGEIVWVNSRYLSYRGLTAVDLAADPWGSIHQDERDDYLKAWGHSLRTGEQFSRIVRIRRFDGTYRWFYARAVASRDKRGVIHHFLGSYMDIHEQRVAEIKAARQEQIEASEAKHKLLANLIPQIIFTATYGDGITFANDQWLSYTGQSFDDCLGLGFMDYVHPEDLAKCRIPLEEALRPKSPPKKSPEPNKSPEKKKKKKLHTPPQETPILDNNPANFLRLHERNNLEDEPLEQILSAPQANGSAGDESSYRLAIADTVELARKGTVKVARDSNGRLSYTTEVRLRSKSGEYRWHLVRCVEIDNIDFGNGASSFFGSATDINDHKILEAKLKEAMDSKSRFLSNMSHEIRTPLIGISGMVSFLQDTELNEEQRDYTNTIQTSANSLLMIINDILDLSKVAAGMMKLKYEWFHTRALIEDVNELVSTMAIAKRLELNYIVDEDVPAWVKGDKIRIRQVLLNVIGNAIKFTAEGEVFSRCRVYNGSAGKQGNSSPSEIVLEFAIIDTGRGFTKEEADLIFRPFSQIDGSSTRQHGGSGLGLVISRQLVELHGGKMQGTAVPGKGSTFTFTAKFGLPTADDAPDLCPPPTASQQQSPGDTASNLTSISRSGRSRSASQITPDVDTDTLSSAPLSSDSSNISSVGSGLSALVEGSTAPSSVTAGLVRLSEAAKATGHDLSQVTLTRPVEGSERENMADPRPPLYSILIVCPQTHSREATSQHIATTLPKDIPYRITALSSAEEARELLSSASRPGFTHIVLNLPTAEGVLRLVEQTTRLLGEQSKNKATILILSDTLQRQQVAKMAAGTEYESLLGEKEVTFIYKPVKPSRFAVIFDPDKVRDLSIDRNRNSAEQIVESQKASYLEIEKRMGNKGYRVLLVEDNPVNQKVLTKYLTKVGVAVDIATDGVDCTDMVFSKPYGYYSLILCDLHMPRKDGYQACKEIRQWEMANNRGKMPIIALSANVMSDVQEKCVGAGFSYYVTKPVDFIDLSRAMANFF